MMDAKARFSGLPVLTEYMDGRMWRLARDCAYRVGSGAHAGRTATARAGFEFDWASVPRAFWRLFPPTGLQGNPYGVAALFHDWVYRHGRIDGRFCSRSEADGLFLEIMLYVGVRPWVARTLWAAVRVGSGWIWARYRRQEKGEGPKGENMKAVAGGVAAAALAAALGGGCCSAMKTISHNHAVDTRVLQIQASGGRALVGVDLLKLDRGYVGAWKADPLGMGLATVGDAAVLGGAYLLWEKNRGGDGGGEAATPTISVQDSRDVNINFGEDNGISRDVQN